MFGGVQEFMGFCSDELWDLHTFSGGREVFIGVSPKDPRYPMLVDFLTQVGVEAGIETISAEEGGIGVTFDKCGARWPSMVFRVRSTFQVPEHITAAFARDAQDNRLILEMYASQGKKFGRGLTHPAIRHLQLRLLDAGYRVPIDGVWNLRTRFQLWRYRRRHHIATAPHITHTDLAYLEV